MVFDNLYTHKLPSAHKKTKVELEKNITLTKDRSKAIAAILVSIFHTCVVTQIPFCGQIVEQCHFTVIYLSLVFL